MYVHHVRRWRGLHSIVVRVRSPTSIGSAVKLAVIGIRPTRCRFGLQTPPPGRRRSWPPDGRERGQGVRVLLDSHALQVGAGRFEDTVLVKPSVVATSSAIVGDGMRP